MTEYEVLSRHIDDYKCKLASCDDENMCSFYRNAIEGMTKKLNKLSIAQGEQYAKNNKQKR